MRVRLQEVEYDEVSCRESGISLATGFLGCKGSAPNLFGLRANGAEREREKREVFGYFANPPTPP